MNPCKLVLLSVVPVAVSGCYVEITTQDDFSYYDYPLLEIHSGNAQQTAAALLPLTELALLPSDLATDSDRYTDLEYAPVGTNPPLFTLINNLSAALIFRQGVNLDQCILDDSMTTNLYGLTDTSPDYQYGLLTVVVGTDYCTFGSPYNSGSLIGETRIKGEWLTYLPDDYIDNLNGSVAVDWQINQQEFYSSINTRRMTITGNDSQGFYLDYKLELELDDGSDWGQVKIETISDVYVPNHYSDPVSGHVRITANTGRLDLFLYRDGVVLQLNDYLEHYMTWWELKQLSLNADGW